MKNNCYSLSATSTITETTHEMGISSPKTTHFEQKQARKIANLEFDNKQLREQNLRLKDEISEQR